MTNNVISLFGALYQRNKLLLMAAVLVVLLFIAGCTASSSPGPTSQFIGGGCGG